VIHHVKKSRMSKVYFKIAASILSLWGGWLLFFWKSWLNSLTDSEWIDNGEYSVYILAFLFMAYGSILVLAGGKLLFWYTKKNAEELGHVLLITLFLLIMPNFDVNSVFEFMIVLGFSILSMMLLNIFHRYLLKNEPEFLDGN
jgi:hypothetical protein